MTGIFYVLRADRLPDRLVDFKLLQLAEKEHVLLGFLCIGLRMALVSHFKVLAVVLVVPRNLNESTSYCHIQL